MDMINVIIDGKEYSVRKGATILEVCKSVGIEIPTLCYLKEIKIPIEQLLFFDYRNLLTKMICRRNLDNLGRLRKFV